MMFRTNNTERVEVAGDTNTCVLKLYNQANTDASATCEIQSNHDIRDSSKIVFGREDANDWSASHNSQHSFMGFHTRAGSANLTEKFRISSDGIHTVNSGGGMYIRGGTSNRTEDTVLWVDKQNNNDWCIKVEPGTGSSSDYGIYCRIHPSGSYAFGVHDLSAWKFRIGGNGAIYATNTTVQSISDVRLKENIVDANSQWDDIKALRFRNFKWKADSGHADGKTYLGLIAQEVETISPGLVEINAQDKEDKENGVPDPEHKNVKYSIVWMKAMKALQEAMARIETLETEVAALKGS